MQECSIADMKVHQRLESMMIKFDMTCSGV